MSAFPMAFSVAIKWHRKQQWDAFSYLGVKPCLAGRYPIDVRLRKLLHTLTCEAKEKRISLSVCLSVSLSLSLSSFELPLCMSRACLGKLMIIFKVSNGRAQTI
jgi:hypothetical protein